MKQTILSVTLLTCFIFATNKADNPPDQNFIISIPRSQINPFYSLIHLQGGKLSVDEYQALMANLEPQIQKQAQDFQKADSVKSKK